uniref:Uncharacterized protein n=1 Tax=Panagrolaimus sp. JU765 TaxID=591449 RepID=A0AC34R652_9BILA
MRCLCGIRDKWIFPKILISCLIVVGLPHFMRRIVPNYNGEDVYFPVMETYAEDVNNEERLRVSMEILKDFDWKIIEKKNWSNVAITIVASNRAGKYLTQSMAFLLDQIKTLELIPQISICNVEPTKYPEL